MKGQCKVLWGTVKVPERAASEQSHQCSQRFSGGASGALKGLSEGSDCSDTFAMSPHYWSRHRANQQTWRDLEDWVHCQPCQSWCSDPVCPWPGVSARDGARGSALIRWARWRDSPEEHRRLEEGQRLVSDEGESGEWGWGRKQTVEASAALQPHYFLTKVSNG